MQSIRLHSSSCQQTSVSNLFIDHYMPAASGIYVKLYLCLLRQVSGNLPFQPDAAAELLSCTEKDVRRGLAYWEKQGLLKLHTDASGNLTDITFLEPQRPAGHAEVYAAAASSFEAQRPIGHAEAYTAAASALPEKTVLTADRVAALQNDQDVRCILFIAERYLGKTLSPTEINSLLYYYDALHFDADLIEYLIDYCVSRGSSSFHYIDKVALGWAQAGVRSVCDAKQNSSLYSRKYYSILNAFGIKGRGPTASEVEFIDHWFDDLHFTADIILEACKRTIVQTQQPSFRYASKILESWHENHIHHLSEIETLDKAHKQKKKTASADANLSARAAGTNNKFNNFPQREYDFEQLEEQLLNQS